ncbi:TRAP transporter substrate-binding protein DctP [Hydrocarboniclastica marina]|uniref:Twin-arginine translocation pathway signal protein n=1 Tax=Hydrocarboniclastica marina TaxID=2259620 RepID=A0A4P7XHF7_9ALTE|nr:TRAP transporter substrate-binding protein DctP [Hydrocarboniclastica marina]QCF26456.1 twin-arginine translocation pathway signal protein [Hydrocarboniclastica marina]
MKSFATIRSHLRSAAAIGLVATLALPGFAAAEEKSTTWRVQSHWPSASSSYEDSLVRLKNQIEERTEGRVKLNLHEAGALFKAQETFNAVSRGIVEMGTISPAYAQDKISLAGIASGLPFAFRNVWEAAYFHKGLGFEDMLREEAAKHNVYWSTDKVYPTEMVVKNPINSWEDFTSLKIRSSGALQKFLDDAGASTSYLPGSELYPALDSGVVDGAHWGAAQGAASMSLYEVAKYHVQPALNIAGTDVIIVSQKALDKLSDKDQETIKQILDEQFWFRTNEYQYKERVALSKAMEENGVEINTLPEDVQQRLTKAAQASWDEAGERSENAAEALEKMKSFLRELGYL